jgi:hypothetical protein
MILLFIYLVFSYFSHNGFAVVSFVFFLTTITNVMHFHSIRHRLGMADESFDGHHKMD